MLRMLDQFEVADIIGNDIKIGKMCQYFFFVLCGIVRFRACMPGHCLRDDVHRLRNEHDRLTVYELPNGCYLAGDQIVGVEPFHAGELFCLGQALKFPDGVAAYHIVLEEFVQQRVETVSSDMEEIVGGV